MAISVHCAHDKIVPLSKLKPHPGNPNKHPPEQIALLAKVIAAQGWRNPIVVSNRSGLITKGHARREAALALKCATVPVDYQDYASESEELADMIADNRIAELAKADRSMLRELAEQLDDGAFDMDLTGFDHDALEELMTAAPPESDIDAEPQIDKAKELRVKWGVERGQIWELGEHRIMCGDARDENDVTRLCDGIKLEICITDPPYNIGFKSQRYKTGYDDSRDRKEYSDLIVKSVRNAMTLCPKSIVTPGLQNEALWFSQFPTLSKAVWIARNKMSGGRVSNLALHEPIMFLGKFDRTSRPTDVFEFTTSFQKDADAHPCPKPLEFVSELLVKYSKGNAYDPLSGSGTLIMACENNHRKCRAMEIDPGYVAVSIQRWADATGKTPRLLNGK